MKRALCLTCLLALTALSLASCRRAQPESALAAAAGPAEPLTLVANHKYMHANGLERTILTVHGGDTSKPVEWTLSTGDKAGYEPEDVLKVIEETGSRLMVQTSLRPGRVSITAGRGKEKRTAHLLVQRDLSDDDADGFPDVAELWSQSDRERFRAWFTAIALSQRRHISDAWPPEKRDCAGLIRFAYAEALKKHTNENLARFKYLERSNIRDVKKYNYPDTPLLGELLFRTRQGAFEPTDTGDGAFSAFADARNLQEFNTHFVSKDLNRAKPGDLLFFLRFAESDMPYHSMIYLDAPAPGGSPMLVYHTGPVDDTAGRIKYISVQDLLRFPDVRWHPVPENENFLGVYRFNILD